ncbi:MAG: hypothetical protein V1922_04735 [bacterium]
MSARENLITVENHTIEEKLAACMSTRSWAAQSFYFALKELLKTKSPLSEAMLRNHWIDEMRKNQNIYPNGWYLPPPNGIGVLFGTEDKYERMNYKSLRPEEMYPKNNILLDKKRGVIYVYASPVDKKTGMIGDWGMTIYFGKNPEIITHLQRCLSLNKQVLSYIQVGMTFKEVTIYANTLFTQLHLSNEVTSITDTSSSGVNVGHTVPASYENWMSEELEIFNGNDWRNIVNMISKKRKFLNLTEPLPIQSGMAFTIEQRLTHRDNPQIPMSSFHTIALIHQNGKKELLTNFDQIFHLTGMNYMLDI